MMMFKLNFHVSIPVLFWWMLVVAATAEIDTTTTTTNTNNIDIPDYSHRSNTLPNHYHQGQQHLMVGVIESCSG
jgi:hypothetical protein